ncbi:MAG: hypothetical protein KDC07_10425, partial [Chitinophagaceae bacterium]|nr:hypothetical protein [Chitinophagaceae bacterium]
KMTGILAMVYLLNVLLFALFVYGIVHPVYLAWFSAALLVKTTVELVYLLPVANFFHCRRRLLLFPVLQPLHIVYIVLAGFLGFAGVYRWKDRTVK